MAKYFIDETTLTDIADAIREKKGTSDKLDPSTFASEISGITAGSSVEIEEKTVTPTEETQTVTPTEGKYLSKVTVNPIPDEYVVVNGVIQITTNDTRVDVRAAAYVDVAVPTSLDSTDYYDGSYSAL